MTTIERDMTENSTIANRNHERPRVSTSSDELAEETRTNRRRILLSGTSLALAPFAGCLGDDDESADDADDSDGDDSLDDDADDSDTFERDVWEPMAFVFEARYEWELFIDGDDGTLVWDVVDIEADQITVETEYVLGDVEFEQTMTGTQQEIQSNLMMSPAGIAFVFTAFSPMWGGFTGEEFTVGDSWSYSTAEGSFSYEVTDIDTTNYPVDCYEVQMHEDDLLVHEGCISPDHGMAVYTAWYEEGDLEIEIELVSFDRD